MQPVPRSFQAHRPVLDEAWPAQPPGSPRYDPKQNFRLPLELEILTNRRCALRPKRWPFRQDVADLPCHYLIPITFMERLKTFALCIICALTVFAPLSALQMIWNGFDYNPRAMGISWIASLVVVALLFWYLGKRHGHKKK